MPQTTRPELAERRPADAPDHELTHPLARLKSAILVFVACDLVLFVGLFLTLWFWVGVGIDYGLFKAFGLDIAQQLTPALRIGVTLILAVTLIALVVWRAVILVNKRFSLTALALVLEKRYRKLLGDRLITALQMFDVARAERAGYSPDLVRHTIREARDRMSQVRVLSVFNWGRLWLKAVLIVLVCVLGMGTALAAHALATGEVNLTRSLKKTADVCGTFTERNFLFIPTPWPRKAQVEVVEFDDDGHPNELRIGKESATPPKVHARSLKWVVGDDPRVNPDGWRAMTVEDLAAFGLTAARSDTINRPAFAIDWTAERVVIDTHPDQRIDAVERGWDGVRSEVAALNRERAEWKATVETAAAKAEEAVKAAERLKAATKAAAEARKGAADAERVAEEAAKAADEAKDSAKDAAKAKAEEAKKAAEHAAKEAEPLVKAEAEEAKKAAEARDAVRAARAKVAELELAELRRRAAEERWRLVADVRKVAGDTEAGNVEAEVAPLTPHKEKEGHAHLAATVRTMQQVWQLTADRTKKAEELKEAGKRLDELSKQVAAAEKWTNDMTVTPTNVLFPVVAGVGAECVRADYDFDPKAVAADLGKRADAAAAPIAKRTDSLTAFVLFDQLDAAADDPANSRKLRKLEVPAVLKMRLNGMQSPMRNALDMVPDATGKYAVEVQNLAESVRFTISAEDYTTARRYITLVPRPSIIDLSRDEYQPAYMHFPTPILSEQEKAEMADLYGTTAIRPELLALRGRAFKLGGRKVSMAGDRATFSVPVGTEVHLTAETDKDLKWIEVRAVGPNPLAAPEFLRAEAKVEERDDKGVIVRERFTELPFKRTDGANEGRLEVARVGATGMTVSGPIRRFTLKFEGKRAIRQLDKPTEFQVEMTDTDNVKSVRTVAIAATDDAPPQVEVLVDPVIRKVGGAYMITPIARVPFLTDSKVWDNEGLSSLRFEFKKTAKEADSLRNLRAMTAASLTAHSLAPTASWAMPATTLHSQAQFDLNFGSTIPQKDSTGQARYPGVDVERYGKEAGGLRRLTLAQLNDVTVPRDFTEWADELTYREFAAKRGGAAAPAKRAGVTDPLLTALGGGLVGEADHARRRAELVARLRTAPTPPLASDRGPPSVKVVKLTNQNTDGDSFELKKYMPELPMKATEEVQQKYDIELYVTARDGNVDLTGKDGYPAEPKMARNLDPIRLLVVSDRELLVEIGKDEEMQETRMADAMVKAKGGKEKLDREFGLIRAVPALTPQERTNQLLTSQVRLTDIGQDLTKARELLTAMRTEYEKLYREMDFNDLPAVNLEKYRNKANVPEDAKTGYLDLLTLLLDDGRAMSKAEKSAEAVRATLGASQVPTGDALTQADNDYQAVINLLNRLQTAIGDGRGINEQRKILQQIIDDQEKIRNSVQVWLREVIGQTGRPDIVLPKDVVKIAVGKKAKVKLGVRWKLYPEKTLFVGFEVPKATGLVFAPEDGIAVKEDGEEVTYTEIEVTAGDKPGVHTVTLRPGTFRPIEMQIEVTK